MQTLVKKVLRSVAGYDPGYYDMHDDANEAFFGRLYLDRIEEQARALGIAPPATVLEAGCQAGRLAIPLAQAGVRVTGIDTSGFALRRAKRHAAGAGVSVRWIRGDLAQVLARRPEWQYDMVVCAEVLYLCRDYRRMLELLARAVRPGGLLCVSHRPKAFYLIEALKRGRTDAAGFVLAHSEGLLDYHERGYFNWQSRDELEALYRGLGMRWLGAFPIDRYAWLMDLAPARLTEDQRADLRALERRDPAGDEHCARYLCVMTQRPEERELH